MDTFRMGRRSFVAAAAATALATGCRGSDDAPDSRGRRRQPPPRAGLTQRGVNYDTGIAYFPDLDATALTRSLWRPEYVRRDMAFVADDLHCNAVLLLGSDPDRLMEAATLAAEQQLYVWIEPRLPDRTAEETVAFLGDFAQAAEGLRADHPDVGLALGCEVTLFTRGIVAGHTWQERFATFMSGQLGDYDTPLNAFLADAATEVRRRFGGQLTYSSGTWEGVDWGPLDVVGVDLYRDAANEATYEQDVRALGRFGKPVVITEFGCCPYRGADERGGDGWSVVDEERDPPIAEDLVRDEQVQADYIDELLTIFEAAKVHGAFVYDFISPDSPHYPDPHYDLDMASYGVVTCYPDGHERAYATTGEFDRKAACDTIATRYR